MKTSTAVALSAGILIAGAVVVVTFGIGIGKGEVDVSLTMNNGVCVPSDPDRLGGWKGRKVRWNVINVDCPSQYVSFRNFRHRSDGGYDPPEDVVDPNPVQVGPIATGSTVAQDAKIVKGEFFKVFKYDIWNGATYDKFRHDHFNLTPCLKCTERCDMTMIGELVKPQSAEHAEQRDLVTA